MNTPFKELVISKETVKTSSRLASNDCQCRKQTFIEELAIFNGVN